MTLRLATAADIPALRDIRGAVRENVLSDPGRVTQRDIEDHLGPRGRTWVHEEGGIVLGFAAATLASASIWALFVHPDHEGRGIGRALLDCAVGWLRAQGVASIGLSTDAGTRAERIYRAAGWQADGAQGGEIRFVLPVPSRDA
jgi:GNAT superfamily N-acetyltransferase